MNISNPWKGDNDATYQASHKRKSAGNPELVRSKVKLALTGVDYRNKESEFDPV